MNSGNVIIAGASLLVLSKLDASIVRKVMVDYFVSIKQLGGISEYHSVHQMLYNIYLYRSRVRPILLQYPVGRYTEKITSWFRDEVNNRRVGGVKDSQHLCGEAVDIGRGMHSGLEDAMNDAGLFWLYHRNHYHISLTRSTK